MAAVRPINTAPAEVARMHLLCAVRFATDRGVGEDALLARIHAVQDWAEVHRDGDVLTMEPSNEMLDLIRTLASEA